MKKIHDSKQAIVEAKIDSYDTTTQMGRELIAVLALAARVALSDKVSKFFRGFSESMGYVNHQDTAVRVIQYLYPENTFYWPSWDKRYSDTVKKSVWLATVSALSGKGR